ncbi:MBL fold metallo-hydrolase [Bacteroidota bacterium]
MSDNVIVFEYLDVNTTAIQTMEGIIIIDTQRSPGIMLKIKNLIEKEFERDDFLYVINTHCHWDHSSGNQIFTESTIVAHENCSSYMVNNPANSIFNMVGIRQKILKLRNEFDNAASKSESKTKLEKMIVCWELVLDDFENEYIITPPSLTFIDTSTISLEKLNIKLIYCGEAHTNNHIFISIPGKNLLFTGDMFSSAVNPGFPINKLVNIPKVLKAIDKVLQSSNENLVVIPGHGELLTSNDLQNLRDIIQERFESFGNKKSQVKMLEQMISKFGLKAGIQKYDELTDEPQNEYYLLEEEFTVLGNRYIAEGKINEAICVFELGLKAFPGSVISLENIGRALVVNGKIESAISYFEQSLKIFPNNEPTKYLLKYLVNKY